MLRYTLGIYVYAYIIKHLMRFVMIEAYGKYIYLCNRIDQVSPRENQKQYQIIW